MKALTVWQPYLAGVLHGDGWCTDGSLGLRTKDRDFADAFAEAVTVGFGFGIEPRLDERGYWLVRTTKRLVLAGARHLRSFRPDTDAERSAWLRGLFDSEGNAQFHARPSLGPRSFDRRVAFYSTDSGTLELAGAMLTALGVPWAVRPTKNSAGHKGTKTVHELRVLREPGFRAFAALVGSSIGRKRDRLAAIAESYQPCRSTCAREAQAKGAAVRKARAAAGGRY